MANFKMRFRRPFIFQGGVLSNRHVKFTSRPFSQTQWSSLPTHSQPTRAFRITYHDPRDRSDRRTYTADEFHDFRNTWRATHGMEPISGGTRQWWEERVRILDAWEKQKSWMLECVRSVASIQQVPLSYALDKYIRVKPPNLYGSRKECERELIKALKKDLQIIRVGDQWKCNKHRVDAMDWPLFLAPVQWQRKTDELDSPSVSEILAGMRACNEYDFLFEDGFRKK